MQQIFSFRFVLASLMVLASFGFANQSWAQGKAKVLDQQEFKKQTSGKDVQLVDVRTPDEYKNGHIKNAKNIDYMSADFKQKLAKLDKSKPVYVYCQAGGRSAKAAKILTELGFKEVYDLQGGYGAWKE